MTPLSSNPVLCGTPPVLGVSLDTAQAKSYRGTGFQNAQIPARVGVRAGRVPAPPKLAGGDCESHRRPFPFTHPLGLRKPPPNASPADRPGAPHTLKRLATFSSRQGALAEKKTAVELVRPLGKAPEAICRVDSPRNRGGGK